jgi:hypothetical protein
MLNYEFVAMYMHHIHKQWCEYGTCYLLLLRIKESINGNVHVKLNFIDTVKMVCNYSLDVSSMLNDLLFHRLT